MLVAFVVAGLAQDAPALDLQCAALRELADVSVAAIRRGRVEITGCARMPGVRAVLVLQTSRGGVGDPLTIAGGADGGKLRALTLGWRSEPVVFVGDRGDPARMVADALAPWQPSQIVAHPASALVDIIFKDPRPKLDDPVLILAAQATGYQLRAWTDASWTMARIQGRERLMDALGLAEADATALVDEGILRPADLATTSVEALLRATAGDRVRAQAWIDAAAWWVEYQSAEGAARRGW